MTDIDCMKGYNSFLPATGSGVTLLGGGGLSGPVVVAGGLGGPVKGYRDVSKDPPL